VADSPNVALVPVRGRLRPIKSFNVYTFRDGKVIRAELFTDPEPAFAPAGLNANQEEEKR
jgi:hypothetical protein